MANSKGLRLKVVIGERPEMRPCKVAYRGEERIALFHCWVTSQSAMSGTRKEALVEFEDGRLHYIEAMNVRFLDTHPLMSEYCFDEDFCSVHGE